MDNFFLDSPLEIYKHNWDEEINPFVSININVFNHEKFLEKCLSGIINQRTTFKVDILIFDDASSDDSNKILNHYKKLYPELIKIFQPHKNLYNSGYFFETCMNFFNSSLSEFNATCEGDDYWIDNNKLQKQVMFLVNNPSYSLTFHKIKYINEFNKKEHYFDYPKKEVLSNIDVIWWHRIPTCSRVFRKSSQPSPWPKWVDPANITSPDIVQNILISAKGKVKFFNKEMAVYNKNLNGITHNIYHIKKSYLSYIYIYLKLLKHLPNKSKLVIIYKIIYHILYYIKFNLSRLF